MWRRTVFDQIGLFDPEFTAPGDYEFLLRFASHGLRAVHVPDAISLFYQNPEGLSFKSRARSEAEFKAIQTKYRTAIPIERIFRVDPQDSAAIARGWTALGNFAMSYEAPWFDNASQDLAFALHCYRTALRHDASNETARFNLIVATVLQARDTARAKPFLTQLEPSLAARLEASIDNGRFSLLPVDFENRRFACPLARAVLRRP
jgi:hypothetical protein